MGPRLELPTCLCAGSIGSSELLPLAAGDPESITGLGGHRTTPPRECWLSCFAGADGPPCSPGALPRYPPLAG